MFIMGMKPNYPQQNLQFFRDKQYEMEVPREIKEAGRILGANYLDFGVSECVAAYNERFLYFMEIVDGAALRYSTFAIQNIVSIVPITRGYMMITNAERKIWLLEVKKSDGKQEGKEQKNLQVQCFLKETLFHSYFLREVTANMIELQIYAFNMGMATKNLLIYQFTVKQKVGVMGYTLDKNYNIVKMSRKQLYGSKIFFDPAQNMIVKFRSFSDSQLQTKKISEQELPLHVFPICKTEQYYGLTKNFQLFNLENPTIRKHVSELTNFQLNKSITHLNYILLEGPRDKVWLFVIEEGMKCRLIGFEDKNYYWHLSVGGRLVGVSHDQKKIRITAELNRKGEAGFVGGQKTLPLQSKGSIPSSPTKSDQGYKKQKIDQKKRVQESGSDQKKEAKGQNKKEQEEKVAISPLDGRLPKSSFKPTKIISRNNVHISKQTNVSKNSTIDTEQPPQQPTTTKEEATIETDQSKKQNNDSQNESSSKIEQKKEQDSVTKEDNKPQQPKVEEKEQSQKPVSPTKVQEQKSEENKKQDQQKKATQKSKFPFPMPPPGPPLMGAFPMKMKVPDVPYERIFAPVRKQKMDEAGSNLYSNPFIKKASIEEVDVHEKPVGKKQPQLYQVKTMRVEIEPEQFESRYEEKAKKQFQNFSQKLSILEKETKVIEQNLERECEVSTQEIKNGFKELSLLEPAISDKILKDLSAKTESTVNDYLSKNLTNKVNSYFKSIMGQTKNIFDTTLTHYSNRKKESIPSLQAHFEEQEHLVNEIRLISADMLTCVQSTIDQGEDTHAHLMQEWDKKVGGIEGRLDKNIQLLENHSGSRESPNKTKQLIVDSLNEIKILLEKPRKPTKQREKRESKLRMLERKQLKKTKKPNLRSVVEEEKKKKKSRAKSRETTIPSEFLRHYSMQ